MFPRSSRCPSRNLVATVRVLESLEDRLNPSLSIASTPDPSLPGLADGDSHSGSFSADGRYLAFESEADNLVPGDANGYADIFIKDLTTGAVRLISTDAAGDPANGPSALPVFSPDGTMVAFESDATNLVPGDTNNARDVFVKNLTTGAVTLISATASGSQGNGNSRFATFSPDSQSVAFISDAADLLPGGTPAGIREVYLKSLATGALTLESANAAGQPADGASDQPKFTPNGQSLAFVSTADNLVAGNTTENQDLYLKNLTSQAVICPLGAATTVTAYTLSPDGTSVVFNSVYNIFTEDNYSIYIGNLTTGTTNVLITGSNTATGDSFFVADPVYGPDGHTLVYVDKSSDSASNATNTNNVYMLDLDTMVSTPISVQMNGNLGQVGSQFVAVGPDGEIAFESAGFNLISGLAPGAHISLLIAGVTLPTPAAVTPPPVTPPPPNPATPTISFSTEIVTDAQGNLHSQLDAIVGDTQTPADQLVVSVIPAGDPRLAGSATGTGAMRVVNYDF